MIHFPRDKIAKLVIRFEVKTFFSHGYCLKCSHLTIPAKLHCPKGDRINKSILYSLLNYTYSEVEINYIAKLVSTCGLSWLS